MQTEDMLDNADDEAPNLNAGEFQKIFEGPASGPEADTDYGDGGLGSFQNELHELLGSGRSWTKVYGCLDQVYRRKLYKLTHSSFSAWMKAEAKREGVSESGLWHKKSAGDFYKSWAAGRPDAPVLSDRISEENINLIRKIAKEDPARGDELMESLAAGFSPSTGELRREWRRFRAGENAQQTPVALMCSDAATLEAAAAALRAAGFEVVAG